MLLAEPGHTPYDLNFQVLGFPVRIHPFFWLGALILGYIASGGMGIAILIWVVAMTFSILLHELGHALTIRRFGRESYIVLYAMGGLAIEGRPRGGDPFGNPWESHTPSYGQRARTPLEQILISAAGPGIQLALAAIVIGFVYATRGTVSIEFQALLPVPDAHLGGDLASNRNLFFLVQFLLYINIFWAFLNLLPVLPLDGGQIALQILTQQDPWGGMTRALWLSVITGGVMAVVGAVMMRDMFLMFFFGSLALSSFMTLQQMGGSGGGRRPW